MILSSQPLEVVGSVILPVSLQENPAVLHEFVIVPDLIIAAILDVDFLQQHALRLDFSTDPVSALPREVHSHADIGFSVVQPVIDAKIKTESKLCVVMAITNPAIDVVEDYQSHSLGNHLL